MNIAVYGSGAMGQLVADLIRQSPHLSLAGIIDSKREDISKGIYLSLSKLENISNKKVEAIIDFSHPSNLEDILLIATSNSLPTLIATTGYSSKDLEDIRKASSLAPILFTRNTSIGVNLISKVVSSIASTLGDDFDIEIIEKHHNKKLDSPSGTAKMLYDSISTTNDYKLVNGREGMKKRETKDIGVHAIRGGSIVGEHSVIFAGLDEVIEIKHEALSKKIFAKGAIRGISYLKNKENGLYTMDDVLDI